MLDANSSASAKDRSCPSPRAPNDFRRAPELLHHREMGRISEKMQLLPVDREKIRMFSES